MIDRIDLYHLVFETFIFGKSGQIQSEESLLQKLPKVGVCPEKGLPIQIWVSNKNVDKKYFYCLLYLQLFGKSGQIQSEESSLQELPKVGVCPEEGVPIQSCVGSHYLDHEVQLLKNIKIGQKRNVVLGNWLNKSQEWKDTTKLQAWGERYMVLIWYMDNCNGDDRQKPNRKIVETVTIWKKLP